MFSFILVYNKITVLEDCFDDYFGQGSYVVQNIGLDCIET
jgi:hypothetical protein